MLPGRSQGKKPCDHTCQGYSNKAWPHSTKGSRIASSEASLTSRKQAQGEEKG